MNPYSDHHSEHPPTDDEFEAELRAKLRRLAADLELQQPSWDELRQRAGGIVVSLRTGQPIGGPPRRGRFPGWVRPALAAAACLALVMAAGILIGRSTTNPDDSREHVAGATLDPSDNGEMPSVSEDGFPVGRAEILYPDQPEVELARRLADAEDLPDDLSWMEDPIEAAERYLDLSGLVPAESGYVLRTEVPPDGLYMREGADGTFVDIASVWWTVREPDIPEGSQDQPVVTQGRVLLRNLKDPNDDATAWAVVGVKTLDLDLTQVRRVGDTLIFTVGVAPRVGAYRDLTSIPVQVWVNDQPLIEGFYGTPAVLSAVVSATQSATIRLQQVDNGEPLSLTENTFSPITEVTQPEAIDPSAVPTVGIDGQQFLLPDPACEADSVALSLDIPPSFRIDSDPVADDDVVAPDIGAPCAESFMFVDGEGRQIVVGTGEPGVTFTPSTGPTCFPWGRSGDGLLAVRTLPRLIWVLGYGLSDEEFGPIVQSSVVKDEATFTADTGC